MRCREWEEPTDRGECVRARASVCCIGILKGQEQNLLSATSLISPLWEGMGFCGLFFVCVFVFFLPTLASEPRATVNQAALETLPI